jgi:integrase
MKTLHAKSIGVGKVFPYLKPRWFTDAIREANIKDFTWHCVRYTWATRLVAAGVDLKVIQGLGGWKNTGMVAPYAHASAECFGPALEKLSATTTATEQSQAKTPVAPAVQ